MDKTKKTGMILLTLATLVACTLSSTPTVVPVSTATIPPVTAVPDRLPFEGTWVSEGDAPEIIIFTSNSMYRVQSDQASETETYSREQFADLISYDLVNNHISLRTQWIRVNGSMRGFDAPNFTITYWIEGDTLRIGVGWDEEFATETDALVYHRR